MHDSVQAVLRDPAFRRSLRQTLLDRALLWLFEWIARLAHLLRNMPSMRSVGLTAVGLIVLFVVVRTFIAARERDETSSLRAGRRAVIGTDDPWASADGLARDGRFEDAAHALYRGVLGAIARVDRVRLDPSRTSGDYARELRGRGSKSVSFFRAFTRRFESAVYGHERCTAEVYAELSVLSDPFRARARAA